MENGEILTIVLVIWITVPLLAAMLSARKKRDTNFWVLSCIVFPPAILILFFLSKREKRPTRMFGEDHPHDDGFFPNRD